MSIVSPCDTDEKKECSLLWKIDDYSTVTLKQGDAKPTIRSKKFSAADDDLSWCLEHTLFLHSVDSVHVSFNLRPDCYDDLRKFESVSGVAKIYLMNMEKAFVTHLTSEFKGAKSSFTLSFDERNRDCKVAEFSSSYDIQKYLHANSLSVLCHITYAKKNKIFTISPPYDSNTVGISECRLLSDLERCFTEDRFKDLTISVQGKQYRAHKMILATRSTVFDKMFEADMLEGKNNHIDIADIEQETFEEMLYYIYTGKVRNLNESAFKLLPVSDKYDLKELGSMCEKVLIEKLSTDNAARILILADTHRAEELKAHTLQFIKENYDSCEDFNDDEFWKHFTAGNARLMKEMMAAFCKKQRMN